MRIRDPEGVELKHILKYADFDGKKVLEIGCGDGRLTYKYAALTEHVTAIDPSMEEIKKAIEKIPSHLTAKLEFREGGGESLPFSDNSFDIAFFAYSLCCFDGMEEMKNGVDEAWRVLTPNGGILIGLQPSLYQPFKGNKGSVLHLISRRPIDLVNYDGGDWTEKKTLSLYALKKATLYDHKFEPMVDKSFTRNTYYNTIEEVIDEVGIELKGPLEEVLNLQTYNKLKEITESLTTPRGICIRQNVVLSILRKLAAPKTG